MTQIIEKIRNEPVLATSFVTATVGLVVAFGVDISNVAKAAIGTFTLAVMAIFARSKVMPT